MVDASLCRDYSLTGPDAKRSVDNGLANGQWYQCPIPRKRMKELMQRKNGPAIRDTLIWFAAMGLSGYLSYHYWGTWAAVPFFVIYGVLFGSASDSRWHECGHRTAFRSTWMNDVVYYMASFMDLREPEVWRWSHTRHHTDTIIVGRDPEIQATRPPNLLNLFLLAFNIPQGISYVSKLRFHVRAHGRG